MYMRTLSDACYDLPDVFAVLNDGVPGLEILQSDLVSERNRFTRDDLASAASFQELAPDSLTGLDVHHRDPNIVTLVMHNKVPHKTSWHFVTLRMARQSDQKVDSKFKIQDSRWRMLRRSVP
jgi:hypothetical protein